MELIHKWVPGYRITEDGRYNPSVTHYLNDRLQDERVFVYSFVSFVDALIVANIVCEANKDMFHATYERFKEQIAQDWKR